MPQEDGPLTTTEIAVVRRWIAEGRNSTAPIRPPRSSRNCPRGNTRRRPDLSACGASLCLGLVADRRGVGRGRTSRGDNLEQQRRVAASTDGLAAEEYTPAVQPRRHQLLVGGGNPGDYGELSLVDLRGKGFPTRGRRVRRPRAGRRVERGRSADCGRLGRSFGCRVFTAADAKLQWIPCGSIPDFATAVSFADDGRFVATASKDCTVKVLDAATGKLFTTFNGHQLNLGEEKGRFGGQRRRFSATFARSGFDGRRSKRPTLGT